MTPTENLSLLFSIYTVSLLVIGATSGTILGVWVGIRLGQARLRNDILTQATTNMIIRLKGVTYRLSSVQAGSAQEGDPQ